MQVKGSKVKGHTLLKRNPKGRLHQDLCKTKELQWVKLEPSMEAHQSCRTPYPAHSSTFSCSPVPVATDPPAATDHSCGHWPFLWPHCPGHTGDSCFQPLWLAIINLPVDRLLKVFPFPCWSTGLLFHKPCSAPRVRGSAAQASAAGPALALTTTCAKEALLRSERSWLSTQLLDPCFSGKNDMLFQQFSLFTVTVEIW